MITMKIGMKRTKIYKMAEGIRWLDKPWKGKTTAQLSNKTEISIRPERVGMVRADVFERAHCLDIYAVICL
ncbi:MAG: hypothetical protein Q4C86_03920 [bacterium]|nr:hypothetical protein [bacterium]